MASPSPTLPILGGVLAAIGASLCCVLPLVLVLLGIGGAWMSLLTDMRPYTPYFLIVVVALFGWAGFQLYRPVEQCSPGSVCAIPAARRRYRFLFWTAALISLVLVTGIYWIPWIA
ncbi:MAG: mercury transporter [Proteobacteria bacterium]|nr:MAG: mercury transporter [Pseudomonadota bacterium]